MANEDKIEKLPSAPSGQTKGDILHSLAKAAAGIVPFAGTAITEVVDKAVVTPAEARMAVWLGLVTEAVNELIEEVDGLTAQSLGSNTAFTTAVIATSRTAMLTERAEKLTLLQSILRTIGGGFVLNEVLRNTFLAAIDRYTPEHVLLLRRCTDIDALANAYRGYNASSSTDVKGNSDSKEVQVEFLIPWLLPEVSVDVAKELFSDLHRDRFCNGSEGFAYTFEPDKDTQVVTIRGQEFLRFIFGHAGP